MSTKKRRWTPEEDAELERISAYVQRYGRRRSRPDAPGTLAQFAEKHGRTLAAVKMRARRKGLHLYSGYLGRPDFAPHWPDTYQRWLERRDAGLGNEPVENED